MDRVHKISCIKSYEKHMIEANKKYWAGAPQATQGSRWIYVHHRLVSEANFIVYEDIVTKGLQEQEQYPVIAVSVADSELAREIDDSFQIKEHHILGLERKRTWVNSARTCVVAWYYALLTYGKKEKLFRAKYRGVAWGDEMHDTIVYENGIKTHGEQQDCFDIDRKTYFRYVKNALSLIDQSYALLKRKRPAYVIRSMEFQLDELFENVAKRMGAEVICCGGLGTTNIQIPSDRKPLISQQVKQQIENYMEHHVREDAESENLFVYQTNDTDDHKGDLAKQLGLDPGKKNVFIMPHILTDVPRENYEHVVYHEFNEWLLETLKIIREIPNVNWIVKDHPLSPLYEQSGYVRAVFEKNKTENMYWCEKDTNPMRIKEIAHCVVTCAGDVGLEYWAYGIPTITTSKGYYSEWGISYQMKTKKEYEETLRHIDQIQPPSKETCEKARRCLTAFKHICETEDELVHVFQDTFRELGKSYKKGSVDELCYFNFCRRYMDFIKKNKVEDSCIFQLKNLLKLT